MKKAAIVFTGCLLTGSALAQNLAPNASFEEVNICTEYHAPCAPCGWVAVSPEVAKMGYLCNGKAVQGDHFITLPQHTKDDTDTRVYVQTRLLCPLRKGETYRVRCYVSHRNRFLPVGLHFDTAFIFRETAAPLNLPPTVELTEADLVKKIHLKNDWYVLEKQFTAQEPATHLVIGHFSAAPAVADGKREEAIGLDSISITPLNGKAMPCDSADQVRISLYGMFERHSIPKAYLAGRPLVQMHSARNGACDTLVFTDNLFLPGSKGLNPRYEEMINRVLQTYRNSGQGKILLTGYAYQPQSAAYNEIISYDKARALATYLVYQQGYSYDDFDIKGMGSRDSLKKDRVEMVLCKPPAPVAVEVPAPDTLVIPDILFKFNSSELNPRLHASLDSLLQQLPAGGSVQLQIVGHTDSIGTNDYNYTLSRQRAAAVARYLQASGRGDDIRQISGKGETQPVTGNHTAEGRRRNRRVEIIIYHTDN